MIFKNEEGTFSVRPAFIGFIRHDVTRRLLCGLFFPLVLALTIVLNLVQALIVCLFLLFRAVWFPISRAKPIWTRPRTKADGNKRLDQ